MIVVVRVYARVCVCVGGGVGVHGGLDYGRGYVWVWM